MQRDTGGIASEAVETDITLRIQVVEELKGSYAKLSDNPYAHLPEAQVMDIVNEEIKQYREESQT